MKNLIDLLEVSKDDLPSIYCDMDMVLCDFLKGAEKVLGMPFVNANKQTRWEKISDTPDFIASATTAVLNFITSDSFSIASISSSGGFSKTSACSSTS